MKSQLVQIVAACLAVAGCDSTITPGTGGGGSAVLALAVICPATFTTATAVSSLAVTYALPATTGGTLPVSASCSPASGATFPRGTTNVTCSATDSRGQTASCSFPVTIQEVPLLKGTRFMAFGDSFTAGEVLNATRVKVVSPAKSYPTQLSTLLLGRYLSQNVIMANEGSPGEGLLNKDGGRDETTRLRYDAAISADRPDAVLLLEGVNDLNGGNFTEAQIASVLGAMVDEAYALGSKVVFLATEPPQIPGHSNSANYARVPVLNELIRSTATQKHAVLVDLYAAMVGDVNALINSDDGLHPYPAGYVVMADTFFAAIKANFEQTATSVARR